MKKTIHGAASLPEMAITELDLTEFMGVLSWYYKARKGEVA